MRSGSGQQREGDEKGAGGEDSEACWWCWVKVVTISAGFGQMRR